MKRSMSGRLVRSVCTAVIALCVTAHAVRAQSEYFNTDAGHPIRVEDALSTDLFSLDLHVPSLHVERFKHGVTRWRFEPSISLGILPRTAIEVSSSFVYREATASPRGGMSGMGFGVFHALNTETRGLPAIALSGDLYAPLGAAKSGGPSYALRVGLTRTTSIARFHMNASIGTYNVSVVQAVQTCSREEVILELPCGGGSAPPIIPDGPCALDDVVGPASSNGPLTAAGDTSIVVVIPSGPSGRRHWLAGFGFDHAFPLASTLIMGDVFAERYVGLFPRVDWTAEAGIRRQWTPTVSLEMGVGRRFRGVAKAWTFTIGATSTTPLFIVHGAR